LKPARFIFSAGYSKLKKESQEGVGEVDDLDLFGHTHLFYRFFSICSTEKGFPRAGEHRLEGVQGMVKKVP